MSMEKDTRETTLNGFDDGMGAERAQNARGTAARLLKTLMRQKWKLLVIFLSVVIGSLFNILAPKVTGVAVNQIFSGVQNALANGGKFQVNWETMGMVLLQLAGLYVLTSAFSYIQQNTMAGVSQTLTLTLRREISEKLNRLPLRYFDRHKKGEVLSRATSDLEKVADTLQDSLSQLLTAFVSIVGSFIMMLVISPTLTLVALVNLLMRFYELQGGRITIDGVDIASMTRGHLRSLMGMVLQDTWLFGGTIRDNIAYGKADATDEQIFAAAKAARADHFIRTMPLGYDTVLSDEIASLSQEQRQLLTIARAILADPAILILDEATSSVDTRTELEIQKAMDALMQGRTSFIIAHRLSTIRDANCILVMKDGAIIEQGSHEELMKLGKFYADLYNSQFAARAA